METRPRDWLEAASGRAYSVATVEAGHALSWRERRRGRALIGTGAVPEDATAARYAAALLTDRQRYPKVRDSYAALTLVAYAPMALSGALNGDWFLVAIAVVLAAIVTLATRRTRARQSALPALREAALARVPEEGRTELLVDTEVPAEFSINEMAWAFFVLCAAYTLFLTGTFVLISVGDGEALNWDVIAVMLILLVPALMLVFYARGRGAILKRFEQPGGTAAN